METLSSELPRGTVTFLSIAAQRALSEARDAVRVRIGLHSAEPYADEDGYSGAS